MVKEEVKQNIAEISKERNMENLKREQEGYKKNIKYHKDLLKRLEEDEKVVFRRYEIMDNNFEIVNPIWKYETVPEFIELIKKELDLKKEQDKNLFDKNREQIKLVIVKQKEALKSVDEEIKRLNGGNKDA